MSAEANNLPIDDELNTTAPQDTSTPWKMPEPVFKRTSGRLPSGFEKQFASDAAGEHDTPTPSFDSVEAYVEPKPKNPTLKFILVLLGMLAMIAFIAVFLTVLYFFFLRSPAEPPL